jgi:hypothetical protein
MDKESLAVISNDSDLMVFDGVPSITMPVGKSRELTTFSKTSLLEELDLPTSHHLQLAAILTKNDYFGGTKMLGIIRNAELVRNIQLDINGDEDEHELVSKFNKGVIDYFELINSPERFPNDNITNAISAFVLCQEDYSDTAAPSPQTHEKVCRVLRQLEDLKLRRRGLLPQTCDVSSSEQITTAESSSMATPTMMKKREGWMMSK